MSTLTIPRSEISGQEISDLLRSRLGAAYNVLPGMRTSRKPLAEPQVAGSDTVLVGRGSNRLFCAHVTIVRNADQVQLKIVPGGLGWDTAVNSLWLVRNIRRILTDALG